MTVRKGTVHLVGAGPGDPGLITRAGLDVLRQADVVVYDRLVTSELLLEPRADARLVYVGKSPDRHAMTQDEINRTLAEEAGAGRSVCRLKGGDLLCVFYAGYGHVSLPRADAVRAALAKLELLKEATRA